MGTQVSFLTADGHVHQLNAISDTDVAHLDATENSVTPSTPAALDTPMLGYWTFLGQDGDVHQLAVDANNIWKDTNLTQGAAGAPSALSGSALTGWPDTIFYLTSNGHVQELNGSAYHDLTGGAHGNPPPAGPSSALTSWADSAYQHVIYITSDGHVHELYCAVGGTQWDHNDLTSIALTSPPPALPGSALTSWTDANYQHVIYITSNGHVHELYYPHNGTNKQWNHNDLTDVALGGPPPTQPNSALTSWADSAYQHVIYITSDGHVHELYYPLSGTNRQWNHNDLTDVAVGNPPPAQPGSALTSWADGGESSPSAGNHQFIFYMTADGHVHQLYYPLTGSNKVWQARDFTAQAQADSPPAPSALPTSALACAGVGSWSIGTG